MTRILAGRAAAALRLLALSAALVACSGGSDHDSDTPAPAGSLSVRSLSSKPEMVTGGSSLIEIAYPEGVSPDNVRVSLNGVDVTAPFTTRDATARTLRGLVTGLTTDSAGSSNTLLATDSVDGATQASLVLVNYPITGPVLSGPHIAPYECRTVESGLGVPLDGDCSATTQVSWFYKGSAACPGGAPSCFKPLADPTAARPADLLSTTTNAGATVPYIVRFEAGTVNRGIYNIVILADPAVGSPLPATFVPDSGWNGKLVVYFSGGGGAFFNQGTVAAPLAPDALVWGESSLARGFAFVTSSELWNIQHSNPHLQGETLMMLKEHFIKHFGVPKWTAGLGASGGSIQQYLIAQLYPGLLDGLQVIESFPETMMPNVYECRLANAVFQADPARWTSAKQVAIQGFNDGTCNSWDLSFASLLIGTDFSPACGVTEPANVARLYNATTNPTGDLFCDVFETNVNLFGKDGSGRARRPIDNVGVQYGLAALNAGTITTTEFLDFNQLVGGFDRDGHGPVVPAGAVVPGPAAARHVGDLEAIRLAWAGGFKNGFSGTGLSQVPILEQYVNASGTADIHDSMQGLIARARLQRANGRTDNHVFITSSNESAAAGYNFLTSSLDIMNAWLDAIAADPSPASTDKVVRAKPALAADACIDKSGNRVVETQSVDPSTRCNTIYPRFSTLRIAAGEPLVQDGIKCVLKPVNQSDYRVTFSNAELVRLNQIFPTGVCDWSQPGVNQVALQGTWLKLPLQ